MFSPKTPKGNRMKMHQEMYKVKTPPWKEAYREKCFKRLRNSRSKLVDQFRGVSNHDKKVLIEAFMMEEWKILCDEQDNLPNIKQNFDTEMLDLDTEVDEILAVVEEIKKELIEEARNVEHSLQERRMLAENHDMLETSNLQSVVDWLEHDEVICPLCQKYSLFQNHSIIFCKCGMRIDTERDGLTLTHLKKQLAEGLDLHSRGCLCTPQFSVISMTSITNLAMTCEACSFMFIVI